MKKIKILILTGLLFSSFNLFSQDEISQRHELIEQFFNQNEVTPDEKREIQCELILLEEQYTEENELNNVEVAFKKVLNTYRESGELDVSQRLYEPNHEHHQHREISEINFVHVNESDKNKNSNESGGYYEKATSCTNSDFETGTFDDWILAYASSGGAGGIGLGSDIGPMNGTIGNHAIMGPGAGNDGPSGNNLPRVYPGGGIYSMRIGDQGTGYNASRATYTFTVTPATELFLYHFAVVMEDPGHSASQQPFMEVKLEIAGNNEACGEYYQAASGSAPGYLSNGGVRYKPWETVSIALTPYMGQVATVTMTTADCAQSGHFGYAYVDAECMAMPNLNNAILNCTNPTLTLEGPPGATNYVWTGPGIVGSSTTQSITVDAPGVYEVEVIPVQGPSCSYFLQTTVIDERGTVTADFDAIPNQVCLGETIDFTNRTTMTGLAGSIASSTWQFGDGNSSTDFEPSHTYTTPGIHPVELTVVTSNNCSETITKNVTVSPTPNADFSVDSVCQGTNSSIVDLSTVDGTNGDNISTWQWDFGDGQTSTNPSPTQNYGSEDLYDITLSVTSNNGCTHSVSKTTAIYPNPVIDFTPTEVCLNFENEFNNLTSISSANTPNTIDSWSWDFGDGATSSVQNPRHTYLTHGVFNATLTATSNNGCSESITKPVTVFELPTADFNFVNACDNEDVALESTSVPNQGTITDYFWDIDNNGNVDYTINPAAH
ncbi:hypothetical protein CW751_14925, partial [Brumimicrobium salinarum]